MRPAWIKELLEIAKEKGFSDFEIYVEKSKRFSTSIYNGDLDKFSASEPAGVSVRGIFEGKMGNAYSEKMDIEALKLLVEDCKSNAIISEVAELPELFAPAKKYPELPVLAMDLQTVEPMTKIKKLEKGEADANAYDARVDQVENQYGDTYQVIDIINTRGLDLHHESGMGYAYFSPIVKEGDETKNEYVIKMFRNIAEWDEKAHAIESVEKTIAMVGASSIPSGTYKTVIAPNAMASLLQVMVSIFSGEAADKGLTYFKDKVGEKVASDLVTIVDDPHLQGGFATVPFDSEGVPTQMKNLIEKGQMMGFVHNLKTAKKLGVAPTGNGFKASFKSSVGISVTNFYLKPGTATLNEICQFVEEGIYLTALDGLHAGINAVTGDFSLSCRGFVIEKGQRTRAVNQCTVSGNFFKMLCAIDKIGSDFSFEEIESNAIYGAASVSVGPLVYAGQ